MNNCKRSKIEYYVDLLKKLFECSICNSYLEQPVKNNCKHNYCNKCVQNLLSDKKAKHTCPKCGAKVNTRSFKKLQLPVKYINLTKQLNDSLYNTREDVNDDDDDDEPLPDINNYVESQNEPKNEQIEIPNNELLDGIITETLQYQAPVVVLSSESENKETQLDLKGLKRKRSFSDDVDLICLDNTQDDYNKQKEKAMKLDYKVAESVTSSEIARNKIDEEQTETVNIVINESKAETSRVYDECVLSSDTDEQDIANTEKLSDQTSIFKILKVIGNKDEEELVETNDRESSENQVSHYFEREEDKTNNQEKNVKKTDEPDLLEKTEILEVPDDETKNVINETICTNIPAVLQPPPQPQEIEHVKRKRIPFLLKGSLKIKATKETKDISTQTENFDIIQKPLAPSDLPSKVVKFEEFPDYLKEIVIETPKKNLNISAEFDVLNETISKSANRVECINLSAKRNETRRHNETIVSAKNHENKNSKEIVQNINVTTQASNTCINNLNQSVSTEDQNTTLNDTVLLENNQSQKKSQDRSQNKSTNSDILNSFKQTNAAIPLNITLNYDSTNRIEQPPNANDILGKSNMDNKSTIDYNATIVYENEQSQKQPTNTANLSIKEIYNTESSSEMKAASLNDTELLPSPSSPETPDCENWEFVCSLLKPNVKERGKMFFKQIGAKVAEDVSASTTHLIVQCEKDLICGVTPKYLKAIARKLWIISAEWLIKCIELNKLIEFAQYEIQGDTVFGLHYGPLRSRLSSEYLFDNYEFLFVGKLNTDSMSLTELNELAEISGARFVKKAKDFKVNKKRVVLFDETVQKINAKTASFMYQSAQIHSVTISWFFDSLAAYSIRDMDIYALYS